MAKFTKSDKRRILALMKRYSITRNEAARMLIQSGY